MMAADDTPIRLTAGERQSVTWLKLKAHLEQKLQNLRGQNDGEDLDPIKTAFLRGQIKFAKGLLALGNEEPPITDG